MDHLDAIRKQRTSGRVLGGGVDKVGSIVEVAAAFGLKTDESTYREVDDEMAWAIVVGILHRDLAYGTRLMSLAVAEKLGSDFIAKVSEPGAKYFTNGEFRRDAGVGLVMMRWNPATPSTFDTGVIVIGKQSSSCLWVAEDS